MPFRPPVPALLFTPDALMGDVFRVTRKLAPSLSYLSTQQVIWLRQELALFELVMDRAIDRAAHVQDQLAGARRRFPQLGRVLDLPARDLQSPKAA